MRSRTLSVVGVGALVLVALVAAPASGSAPGPRPPHPARAMNIAAARTLEQPGRRISTGARRSSRIGPGLDTAQGSPAPVVVDVHGDVIKAAAAVHAAGGQVRATAGGALTATVPGNRLATVAGTDGVSQVALPVRPVEEAVSAGVGLSGADAWQSAQYTGAGVKLAIIDAGFLNLPVGIAAGQTNYCTDPNADSHGSAVAEIVHQMAPNAQLYLYCVDTAVEVNTAEQAIVHLGGVKAISSSLGWPGDSRGDGTGTADSVAHAIHDARLHNILWVNSAGNEAQDHWSGKLADANTDHVVDLNGTSLDNEDDEVFVAPGQQASVFLTWDNWPTSVFGVAVEAFGYQCPDTACDSFTPLDGGQSRGVAQSPNTRPWIGLDISNDSAQPQFWDVYVETDVSHPAVRYDLTYFGAVSASYLSSVNAARAAAGSVDPVAQSPDAMAVGAADAAAGTCADSATKTATNLPLELYSSQGPTIDGRTKPDIVGYDGTASGVLGVPFCGTSAAAPHVAGAVALVAQEHPTFTAAELEAFLTQRANHGAPANPAGNALGSGALTLGAAGTTGTCSIAVPARVAIGSSATTITASAGSDCAAAGMTQARWNIAPGSAAAGFAFSGASTTSYVFHDTLDTAGTLQVQPGGASTSSVYGGIAQNSVPMVAKYTTWAYSASSRKGSAVYVNGLLHQWSAHGMTSPTGSKLWLQRYIGGGWQTMLSRTTATGQVSVGFIQTAVYQYRWVFLETATQWAGGSASTIR